MRYLFLLYVLILPCSGFALPAEWREAYQQQRSSLRHLDESHPRLLVLFSATPGMGKTTLSLYLEEVLRGIRLSADDARKTLREKSGSPSMTDREMGLEGYIHYFLEQLDRETDNHLLILDRSIDSIEEEAMELAEALGYDTFVVRLQCDKATAERRIILREADPSLHLSRLERWYGEYERFPGEFVDYLLPADDEWEELPLEALVQAIEAKIESLPETERDLPKTPPELVGELYSCLSRLLPVLRDNDIAHWAFCGTALGAVRHGGMIPWDDDIDLAIYEGDREKLLQAERELNEAGLTLYQADGYFKVLTIGGMAIPIEGEPGKFYPWSYPFIDLFPMEEREGVVHYSSERLRKGLPKEYFTIDQLQLPLSMGQFGPFQLPLPHDIEAHFDRVYGGDWRAVAYAELIHHREKRVKKVKVRLEDCSPADYAIVDDGIYGEISCDSR